MSISKGIMLVFAGILDFIGIVLFFFDFLIVGNILSFLTDFFGFLTIGLWSLFKGSVLRFGLTFLSELIPFWGDIFPTWTIFVATKKD